MSSFEHPSAGLPEQPKTTECRGSELKPGMSVLLWGFDAPRKIQSIGPTARADTGSGITLYFDTGETSMVPPNELVEVIDEPE